MFRSRYCVSLCFSVYCLCVNVYCTTATQRQLTNIYHIISYHIISYHIISYHIISYHISYIISYHIISYHIISYHIISYHIMSYHITSYHINRLSTVSIDALLVYKVRRSLEVVAGSLSILTVSTFWFSFGAVLLDLLRWFSRCYSYVVSLHFSSIFLNF